jgi:peptidyl-prolyl cis-trans isomerase A (cyclophilin A)
MEAAMKRRSLLAAAATLAAWPALGQIPDDPVKVEMRTEAGLITAVLFVRRAPLTAANFLRYADAGRLDGATFYRAVRTQGAPGDGLIEGGLQNDPARLYPPIAHESTLVTGLAHKDGTLSMARYAPGTATADFFICAGDAAYLDADPRAPGDNAGYAAFGQVVQGMEVVRAILARPTTGKARNPVMQGQILDPPVAILQVRRSAPA